MKKWQKKCIRKIAFHTLKHLKTYMDVVFILFFSMSPIKRVTRLPDNFCNIVTRLPDHDNCYKMVTRLPDNPLKINSD